MNSFIMSEKEKTLVEENISFVYWKAQKWATQVNNFRMIDEFVSICVYGMIKAAHTMDDTRKVKFISYANKCMDNEVLMYLRKNSKQEIPFSCIVNPHADDTEITEIERLLDLSTEDIEITDKIKIGDVIDKLPDLEFNIIFMYFFCEYKEHEIASMISTSQSNVSRIKRRAIKLLRRIMKVK